jgi:hypothetical protein
VRIIIECPENILHLEGRIHLRGLSFRFIFKPLAVRRRTIHFANRR